MFGENSANFSKKTVTLFGKTPSCKKSQSFFILVSPDFTDTFLFYKIFCWSKFWRVWIRICVVSINSICSSWSIASCAAGFKCPRLSLLIIMSSPENQQNRIDILFYYSMHEYSGILACFEHSNFFKVNLLASRDTRLRAPLNLQQKHSLQSSTTTKLTASRLLRSNYELFNHNNFNIRYWSWNYRGCWHQTCPPIDPRKRF